MMPKVDPELRDQCERLRRRFASLGLAKQAAEVELVLRQAEEDSLREQKMGRKAMDEAFDAIDRIHEVFSSLPENATNSDLCSAVEQVQSQFEVVVGIKDSAPSFLSRLASKVETDVWRLAVESASGDMRSPVTGEAKKIVSGMIGGLRP